MTVDLLGNLPMNNDNEDEGVVPSVKCRAAVISDDISGGARCAAEVVCCVARVSVFRALSLFSVSRIVYLGTSGGRLLMHDSPWRDHA